MDKCAKCGHNLHPGITRCTDCNASLVHPGTPMELLGWVLTLISTIPIIIGLQIARHYQYWPLVFGAVVLFAGLLFILVGRMRSSVSESPVVRETDAEPQESSTVSSFSGEEHTEDS